MENLRKKYKAIFDAKFQGRTISSNIVDTSSDVHPVNHVNYFNRKTKN